LSLEVVNVTPAAARRIGETHRKWGKGFHPAGLNFGDCFAYEAAKAKGCPLLFIGNDFSRTDIESVL
jgi:ribonuclease VapC